MKLNNLQSTQFKIIVTIIILFIIFAHPNKNFAADQNFKVETFPYQTEVTLKDYEEAVFNLSVKPGQLLTASYETISFKDYTNRSDGDIFKFGDDALAHFGTIDFKIDGNYKGVYPRLLTVVSGNSSWISGNNYKWSWNNLPLKTGTLKYFNEMAPDLISKEFVNNNLKVTLSNKVMPSAKPTTLNAIVIFDVENYQDANIGEAGKFTATDVVISTGIYTGYLVNQYSNDEDFDIQTDDVGDLYKISTTPNTVYDISVTTTKSDDSNKIYVTDFAYVNEYSTDYYNTLEIDKKNNRYKIKALKDYIYFSVNLDPTVQTQEFLEYRINVENENTKTSDTGYKSYFKSIFCKITFSYFTTCKFDNSNLSDGVLDKENASEDIAGNAKDLADLLSKPDYEKLLESDEPNPEFYKDSYCKFKDGSDSDDVPELAKQVYDWSKNWSPITYPENYVECTAFVHMVYNMSGKALPKRMGDAKDWVKRTDIFDTFKNKSTNIIPENGDIFVWSAVPENSYGHVGIVGEIDQDSQRLIIYNANTPSVKYPYKFTNTNGNISVREDTGKNSFAAPFYWIRKK